MIASLVDIRPITLYFTRGSASKFLPPLHPFPSRAFSGKQFALRCGIFCLTWDRLCVVFLGLVSIFTRASMYEVYKLDFMTRKRWVAAPFAVLLAVVGVGCPAFGDETSFYVGDSRVTLTIPHGLVSVLTNAPNSLGRLWGRSTPAALEALDVLLTSPATSDLGSALEYPDDAVLKDCYRRWVIIQTTKDHMPVTEGE